MGQAELYGEGDLQAENAQPLQLLGVPHAHLFPLAELESLGFFLFQFLLVEPIDEVDVPDVLHPPFDRHGVLAKFVEGVLVHLVLHADVHDVLQDEPGELLVDCPVLEGELAELEDMVEDDCREFEEVEREDRLAILILDCGLELPFYISVKASSHQFSPVERRLHLFQLDKGFPLSTLLFNFFQWRGLQLGRQILAFLPQTALFFLQVDYLFQQQFEVLLAGAADEQLAADVDLLIDRGHPQPRDGQPFGLLQELYGDLPLLDVLLVDRLELADPEDDIFLGFAIAEGGDLESGLGGVEGEAGELGLLLVAEVGVVADDQALALYRVQMALILLHLKCINNIVPIPSSFKQYTFI